MKFLFRSSDALCLPQALRVKNEGNVAKLSVHRPGFGRMGNGLIDKSISFEKDADWADVVVYDVQDGPLGDEADKLRARGKAVAGTSALGMMLEHDRKFGIDFAKASGVKCPEVQEFKGIAAFAKAREFIASKPRNIDWVLKVNGKAPGGVGTFVSKDGRQGAQRMLKHWEELYRKEAIRPDFVVTQKIDGCEISTEAWFNGRDFLLPNHTIEKNKFFPGDLGEKVGCCGNVVWATSLESPLYKKLLEPLRDKLWGKFVGPLDVNVIIEKSTNEPVFLEYSPRFGYDAVFALMELVPDLGQFLSAVATGQSYQLDSKRFAGDVRVHVPPFPAKGAKEGDDECVGVPIFGVDVSKYNPHQHLVEVMIDRDDELVTSGPHGYVLSVSATGESVRDAQDNAYKQVEKIHIPNMRYRNDLSDAIEKEYQKIEATGWLGNKSQTKIINLLEGLSRRQFVR